MLAFRTPIIALAVLQFACGPTVEEDLGSSGPEVSFEQFVQQTYREPWNDGVFIVNGDTPIENDKQLREFYDQLYAGQTLIVQNSGGQDAVWSAAQKHQLTYCISNDFGGQKQAVIAAMAAATDAWEQVADVDFTYLAAQDGACNASNAQVLFDIRPTSGAPYLARAFFPNQSRYSRNVIIDATAFSSWSWPLEAVLLHELGHALGFRHEHTRPDAGACYEDSSWRELTPYDSSSVMHYPQCGGTGQPLTMSAYDAEGAAAIYGQPGADSTPPPAGSGTPQSGSASGDIEQGKSQLYQPMAVVPGTAFKVDMTGTGDADLYVRFDAQPTATSYDCRPYLAGSQESCELDVPAGATEAHVMVYGYAASTFSFTASWIAP